MTRMCVSRTCTTTRYARRTMRATAASSSTLTDYGPDYAAIGGAGLEGSVARTTPAGAPPLIILKSDDLESTLAAAGAVIVEPIFDFPQAAIRCRDPAGNVFGVWAEQSRVAGVSTACRAPLWRCPETTGASGSPTVRGYHRGISRSAAPDTAGSAHVTRARLSAPRHCVACQSVSMAYAQLMRTLYMTTAGSTDPTRASIPLHLAVNGSLEVGHDVGVVLAGDATELLKPAVRDSLEGVGVPPVRGLLAKAQQHNLPIYV